MRSTGLLLLLVTAAGCAGTRAAPCSSATGNIATAVGVGTLRLKPDGVSFSVGVETRAAAVVEAFNANAKKLERVIAALKEKGVAPAEIQTSNLDVNSLTSNSGQPAGFSVSNQVTVRLRDVALAPAVLQAAAAAGANQVGGLRFFVRDPAASQRRGFELAFQDARSKAEAFAALSTKTLGAVVCVSEDARPASDVYDKLGSLGYVATPRLEPGSEVLTFRVSVVFALK